VVLPFGFTQFLGIEWHRFDVAIWLKIIFIVVGITYLTYLFNALAIKQLKSSVVGSFIYLQPFMASLFAYFWRNDTIKSTQVFLGAVIMLGVYLVSRRKAQS
jgi:drug/metabolite transporter (DMT)-like permease